MELIYFNDEVIAVDLDTASNEDISGFLDWVEEQER